MLRQDEIKYSFGAFRVTFFQNFSGAFQFSFGATKHLYEKTKTSAPDGCNNESADDAG
jgi:hypothetical protein